MGEEKWDEAKGRVKEAAGDLTDDESLQREGKLDQAGASVKKKVGEAGERLDDAVDTVKDKIQDMGDKDR